MVLGTRCSASRSIRHGLWFHNSHLTFQEVLYLTYDILRREPAQQIQYEHHTITNWGKLCRVALLVYLEGYSEKIGDPNKTVEIDESKFGRRKYHRGHPVTGQWVFGGVNESPVELSLFPYRIAPPTHW
jgi:hypothetical protein